MQDEKMREAIEQFILQRINDFGVAENEILQNAYQQFAECTQSLEKALTLQQKSLYRKCENAYGEVDGEIMNYYYRAGFSDAVLFLAEWRNMQ